jgi:hypothetical protein
MRSGCILIRRRCIAMPIDVRAAEKTLLKKIIESYLSELRLEIVKTKHDKSALHEEETLVKGLLQKVS